MPRPHAAALLWVSLTMCLVSVVVCGCGGGGASSPTIGQSSDVDQLGPRSVQLNNYNNWAAPSPRQSDYDRQVEILARRDRICMSEVYSFNSSLTPDRLRQLNPRARIFRLYDLICKNSWDSDWKDYASLGDRYMCTPIFLQHISASDWWLRDGQGNIIKENERTWFLDVGKPGFKEMMLDNILSRMEGKGFDGVVLDYHGVGPDLYAKWIIGRGLQPPSAYPTEQDWFTKAVRPMIQHVVGGLRSHGYQVVVNCAGEYYTQLPELQWLRSQIDGSIYEVWSLQSSGDWLSPRHVEQRINSYLDDPLEAWTADYGLRGPGDTERGPDPEYDRKCQVALAMYYIALPQAPALRAKRSYHHYKNMQVYWENLWDWRIGEPEALPVKMSDKYFWSRKYTGGLVLLNYDEDQTVTYVLDRRYRTPTGQVLSGSVTVRPHTGLILAVDGAR